jgi:hypothetical protein
MTNSLTSPTGIRPAATTRAGALTLAASGALLTAGGILHPAGPWSEQLVDGRWIPAHLGILLGAILLVVALLRLSAAMPPSRVRTAARVAAAAAGLTAAESIPHLMAFTDAHAVMHGGATPLLEIHMVAGLFTNAVLSISLIVLAVLAAPSRALGGGPAVAVLVVLGGLAFAAAAPTVVATGVDAFAVLFSGSILIGLWLLVSGVLLARRP